MFAMPDNGEVTPHTTRTLHAPTQRRAAIHVADHALKPYPDAEPGAPDWDTAAEETAELLRALGLTDDPHATHRCPTTKAAARRQPKDTTA